TPPIDSRKTTPRTPQHDYSNTLIETYPPHDDKNHLQFYGFALSEQWILDFARARATVTEKDNVIMILCGIVRYLQQIIGNSEIAFESVKLEGDVPPDVTVYDGVEGVKYINIISMCAFYKEGWPLRPTLAQARKLEELIGRKPRSFQRLYVPDVYVDDSDVERSNDSTGNNDSRKIDTTPPHDNPDHLQFYGFALSENWVLDFAKSRVGVDENDNMLTLMCWAVQQLKHDIGCRLINMQPVELDVETPPEATVYEGPTGMKHIMIVSVGAFYPDIWRHRPTYGQVKEMEKLMGSKPRWWTDINDWEFYEW
ncbi:hypothetical protein H0H93_009627, partial [Arthromyces matolae]